MNKVVYAFLTAENIPFYIGMGSIDRCRNHKKGTRNWRWWEMMKDNKDYKFKIIDRSLTKQQAWDIEIDLIKEFGRKSIDKNGILTNLHPGGSYFASNPIHNQPVVQFSLKGFKIKEWENYRVANKDLNTVSSGHILSTCKGGKKSTLNYQWFFKSEIGDLNFVGSVKRMEGRIGNHNCKKQYHTNLETWELFPSRRSIKKAINTINVWTSLPNNFNRITKEEYYYLKELKLCV